MSAAAILLNKKLGLGLEAPDILAFATVVTGYIVQSGLKSAADAKAAGVAAAAKVDSLPKAAAELAK